MQMSLGQEPSVERRGRRPKARWARANREASVKRSNAANDNLINHTLSLWRRRSGRELSREDAREISENLAGFFEVLIQWSRATEPVPANDNSERSCCRAADARHER